MLKCFGILFTLLLCHKMYGQRDRSLPWVSYNVYGDSCYEKVKSEITRLTEYSFGKHPLIWAREQLQDHLGKTDTTFDDTLHRKTVYYYARTGHLIQIVTTSTLQGNKSERTKIFDDSNNLVFWENLEESRNTVMRIRRGYDDLNRLLFECVYWETPLARLRIFPKEKQMVLYSKPVCDCDFWVSRYYQLHIRMTEYIWSPEYIFHFL